MVIGLSGVEDWCNFTSIQFCWSLRIIFQLGVMKTENILKLYLNFIWMFDITIVDVQLTIWNMKVLHEWPIGWSVSNGVCNIRAKSNSIILSTRLIFKTSLDIFFTLPVKNLHFGLMTFDSAPMAVKPLYVDRECITFSNCEGYIFCFCCCFPKN